MLNPQAKLNPKLWDKDLPAAPARAGQAGGPGRVAQAGVEQAPIFAMI